MIPDPRRDLTPQQRIRLMEEEGRRKDASRGERAIGWITGIILIAFIVLAPAMVNLFFGSPKP